MGTNYYLHYNEGVVGECCACGTTIKKQKVRHCIGHGDGTYDYFVGEFS